MSPSSISPGNAASGNPEATPSAGASAVASLLTPMVGVLGAVADFTAAAARQRLDPSEGPKADASLPGEKSPAAADFLQPVGDAMLIAANRSVSFWFGLGQIVEARVKGLETTDVTAPESDRLVAADQLRALLREVGDLASREARLLQNDLAHLDERIAQSLQQPDASDAYRRRWRSKA